MLIGQQAGPTSDYKVLRKLMKDQQVMREWNNGMPTPVSYERAIKAISTANLENRIIIIFVDTPGADPTEESEAGGIAWRIGDTIHTLVEVEVPTLSIIMNRACSGGAIALTGCDVTLAMEYATYLVITPEACSSILFHTRDRANEAAEASRITATEGLELGIIDELIPEKDKPAHRFPETAVETVKNTLDQWLNKLAGIPKEKLLPNRIERWKQIGQWSTASEDYVTRIQKKVSTLPVPRDDGYIKRHKGCYDHNGSHKYDPVQFASLKDSNFVCQTCGFRYTRPSVWDVMDLLLDEDSFIEHTQTRFIIDKDILVFPGYSEKLEEIRSSTGMLAAMITGDATILDKEIVYCGADFGFLGGSFCMTTGEKIWQAAQIAMEAGKPIVLHSTGGGARMHEGCSSMVSIPKAHMALTMVEKAGLKVITIITDPTLGGVAIGYGSRGFQLFEKHAGNIGFSGRRVIEQYTGHKTSKEFQTTMWLNKHGHVKHIVTPTNIREEIINLIEL
jgi:acetyl-CoA carboxylase beta subunit